MIKSKIIFLINLKKLKNFAVYFRDLLEDHKVNIGKKSFSYCSLFVKKLIRRKFVFYIIKRDIIFLTFLLNILFNE